MLKRLVLALPVIVGWGCIVPLPPPMQLTQQGSAVQVADENIVRPCQYLGDVTGASDNNDGARIDARNQAAAMGATQVVFVSATAPILAGQWAAQAQTMARAYRCQAPAAQAAGGSSDHVAKVRAREQAAGAAADAPQH